MTNSPLGSAWLPVYLLGTLVVSGCKSGASGPASCPAQCPAGQTCSAATGMRCVPVAGACPTTGCGQDATCRADNVCTCLAGFVDCNRDLGQAASDGCECQGGCAGAACAASGTCSPATAHACGNVTLYCDNSNACVACPTGTFNCDGLGDCESPQPCDAGACAPERALACGTDGYCSASGACAPCPAGKQNCDGVQDCEHDGPCGDAGPAPVCDPACTDYAPTNCVRNPAAGNRCEECLVDRDCTDNPRSHGPRCDTTDLAGTGYNWCVCSGDDDCVNSTLGKRCLQTPTANPSPAFSQCTCQTDADCRAPYAICEAGSAGYGRCRKPCREEGPTTPRDQTCAWFGRQGMCDETTGRCIYGPY